MCPICGHAMIIHEGDGEPGDPYICTAPGCYCVYEIGVGGRPEFLTREDP